MCKVRVNLTRRYVTFIIYPQHTNVKLAAGGIGRKLSILHDWLYGCSPTLRGDSTLSPKGKASIRGIEIQLTPAQVLEAAKRALSSDLEGSSRYQSWYVQVDDQKVAPKWLVNQITSLPVSNFVTDEALRVLNQLGVEVRRT